MRIPTVAATPLTELRDAAVSRKAIAAGAAAFSAAAADRAPADTIAVVLPSPTILAPDVEAAVFGAPSRGAAPGTSVEDAGKRPDGPARVVITSPAVTTSSKMPVGTPLAPAPPSAGAPPATPGLDAERAPAPVAETGAGAPPSFGEVAPRLPVPIASPAGSAAEPRVPSSLPENVVVPDAPPVELAPWARPASARPRCAIPVGHPANRAAAPAPGRPALVLLPGALASAFPRPPPSLPDGGLARCRPGSAGVAPRPPSVVRGADTSPGAVRAGVEEAKVAAAVDALLAEKGKLPGALGAAHAAIRNGSVEVLLYGKTRPAPLPDVKAQPLILAGDEPTCARDAGSPRVEVPSARTPVPGPRSAASPAPLARPEAETRLGDALVAALPILREPRTFERLVDGVRRALVAPGHADASPHAAPGLSRAAPLHGSSQTAPSTTRSVVDEDAYASERLFFTPRPAVWNEAAAVRAQIEHELAQRDRRTPRRRGPSFGDLVGGALNDLIDALFDEAVHLCTDDGGRSRSFLGELVAAARAISSRVVQRHGTAFDRLVGGGITAPLVDALLGEILGGVPLASRRALLVLVSAPRVESAAALLAGVPPANTSALVAVAPEIAPFASGIGARLASASAGIASLVVYRLVGRADLLVPCADPELVRARTRRLLAELAELEAAS